MDVAGWVVVAAGSIGAVAAVGSAFSWWRSALIPTPEPIAYLDSAPDHVRRALADIGWWNRIAATLAGLAAACQAITLAVPLIWPATPPACPSSACPGQGQTR